MCARDECICIRIAACYFSLSCRYTDAHTHTHIIHYMGIFITNKLLVYESHTAFVAVFPMYAYRSQDTCSSTFLSHRSNLYNFICTPNIEYIIYGDEQGT